jgi:hypothetical protein
VRFLLIPIQTEAICLLAAIPHGVDPYIELGDRIVARAGYRAEYRDVVEVFLIAKWPSNQPSGSSIVTRCFSGQCRLWVCISK